MSGGISLIGGVVAATALLFVLVADPGIAAADSHRVRGTHVHTTKYRAHRVSKAQVLKNCRFVPPSFKCDF